MDKFIKGDRVVLSQIAVDAGIAKSKTGKTGTVGNRSYSENCTVVRWDGMKYTDCLHNDFLELTSEKEIKGE